MKRPKQHVQHHKQTAMPLKYGGGGDSLMIRVGAPVRDPESYMTAQVKSGKVPIAHVCRHGKPIVVENGKRKVFCDACRTEEPLAPRHTPQTAALRDALARAEAAGINLNRLL